MQPVLPDDSPPPQRLPPGWNAVPPPAASPPQAQPPQPNDAPPQVGAQPQPGYGQPPPATPPQPAPRLPAQPKRTTPAPAPAPAPEPPHEEPRESAEPADPHAGFSGAFDDTVLPGLIEAGGGGVGALAGGLAGAVGAGIVWLAVSGVLAYGTNEASKIAGMGETGVATNFLRFALVGLPVMLVAVPVLQYAGTIIGVSAGSAVFRIQKGWRPLFTPRPTKTAVFAALAFALLPVVPFVVSGMGMLALIGYTAGWDRNGAPVPDVMRNATLVGLGAMGLGLFGVAVGGGIVAPAVHLVARTAEEFVDPQIGR